MNAAAGAMRRFLDDGPSTLDTLLPDLVVAEQVVRRMVMDLIVKLGVWGAAPPSMERNAALAQALRESLTYQGDFNARVMECLVALLLHAPHAPFEGHEDTWRASMDLTHYATWRLPDPPLPILYGPSGAPIEADPETVPPVPAPLLEGAR